MYRHETASFEGSPALLHYRVSEANSGLIIVKSIGATVATVSLQRDYYEISEAGLIMPDEQDVAIASLSRLDRNESRQNCDPKVIEATNLEEFVRTGIMHWREYVETRANLSGVHTHLAERRRIITNTSVPGLEVIVFDPETEFEGYVATPPEIEAMTSIATSVAYTTQRTSASGFKYGQYL